MGVGFAAVVSAGQRHAKARRDRNQSRADDRGVFVMLDSMMPSRLARAFPPGVEMRRVGLAEAVRETEAFLGD